MAEPRRSELFDLYKTSVEEYRFQVNLNWDRSKYFWPTRLFDQVSPGPAD